jgi:septal ring factor EnvC (AmiA/AmiB activator)
MNTPSRIFLQWHGDAEPSESYDPPLECEVTWCRERVFEHDIKFESTDRLEQLERELDFSEKTGRQIWQANERLKAELEQERALADRLAEALTDSATWSHALPAYQAWKEARDESHETRPVL